MDFVLRYHREPRTESDREALYGWIRIIAYWLDNAANIGGVNVGLEAFVGLIPFVGDFIGVIASLYMVFLCYLFGIPNEMMLRMIANVVIDFFVGIIPWVGDILDVFYKSNQYNLSILSNWLKSNGLVDVERYNREHPLANETESKNHSR